MTRKFVIIRYQSLSSPSSSVPAAATSHESDSQLQKEILISLKRRPLACTLVVCPSFCSLVRACLLFVTSLFSVMIDMEMYRVVQDTLMPKRVFHIVVC